MMETARVSINSLHQKQTNQKKKRAINMFNCKVILWTYLLIVFQAPLDQLHTVHLSNKSRFDT